MVIKSFHIEIPCLGTIIDLRYISTKGQREPVLRKGSAMLPSPPHRLRNRDHWVLIFTCDLEGVPGVALVLSLFHCFSITYTVEGWHSTELSQGGLGKPRLTELSSIGERAYWKLSPNKLSPNDINMIQGWSQDKIFCPEICKVSVGCKVSVRWRKVSVRCL